METGCEHHDKELNVQYNAACWTSRLPKDVLVDDHIKKGQNATKQARLIYRNETNVPYKDDDDVCNMDIFQPDDVTPDAPIFIFTHGGIWQIALKDDGGHCILALVKHGIITVSQTYTVAPKGTLQQMVEEVEEGIVFIAKRFPQSRGIFIGGHSAGGHLTAMMLTVDWTKHGLPQDLIKGALLVSGLFDLCPIVHTYINDKLKITEEEAKKLSPTKLIKETCQLSSHCPIIVVVGEEDSPAFKKQSLQYGQQLKDGGLAVKVMEVKGHDHFHVLHDFAKDDYEPTKELVKMITGQDK